MDFTARAFYLALIWVHRVLTIFLWSSSHLMPLLAPIQTGTERSSFSSVVTVTLSSFYSSATFSLTPEFLPSLWFSLVKFWLSLPLLLKCLVIISYNSKKGENLCIKHDSPESSASSSKLRRKYFMY